MDPARRKKIYADLARAMVEDATWVFLVQQVDIYATRDRVTWTPRADQWLLLHEASLK
jgi:ABC-type transport system substrate-binding protein